MRSHSERASVLLIIIGLWALRHVLLTLLALVVLLGIFWVVNGTIELFTALSHRGLPKSTGEAGVADGSRRRRSG